MTIADPSPSRLYVAAPITEAVAEVRFATPVDLKKLKSASRKLAGFYPNEVLQKARNVSVDFAAEAASFSDEDDIIRRSSADEADIAVLRRKAVSVSRLAPYTQWSDFRSQIERDLSIVMKPPPHRQIERVGLRYINRVDIPLRDGTAPHEDYLNLHIHIPDLIERVGPHALVFDTIHNGFGLHIQSGTMEAPVPNTLALVLDIDVFTSEDMPQDLLEAMQLLDRMRDEKNLLFEAFVSDAARQLFDRG